MFFNYLLIKFLNKKISFYCISKTEINVSISFSNCIFLEMHFQEFPPYFHFRNVSETENGSQMEFPCYPYHNNFHILFLKRFV